jgi:hypothetical protein
MKLMTGTALAIACSAAAFGGEAFDIDFKGGSLAEWVKAVQSASPDCNIVLLHSDSTLKLPAVSLVGVTSESCAYLTDSLPGINVDQIGGEDGVGRPIWVIQQREASRTGRGQRSVETGHRTSVFAIPLNYRDAQAAADLLLGLESICNLGGLPKPEILMNRDMGVMAVRGVPTQLSLVAETLEELPHRSSRREGQAAASENDTGVRAMLLERIETASKARATASTPEESAAAVTAFRDAYEALHDYRRAMQEEVSPHAASVTED